MNTIASTQQDENLLESNQVLVKRFTCERRHYNCFPLKL